MPTEIKEGVISQAKPGWNHLRNSIVEGISLTTSRIDTLDLISEGSIEGLMTGKWTFVGNLGSVGWSGSTFTPYIIPSGYTDIQYLRSIYWNEVPVLNDNGQFNFQNINTAFTVGLPNGEILTSAVYEQTVSRSLGERLRGGEFEAKIYRILNKECRGAIINVKFGSLYVTLQKDQSPYKTGDIVRTTVSYDIYYKPVFSSAGHTEDFSLAKSEKVDGKVQNGYVRSSRIEFESESVDSKDFIGWEIKIVRSTPDSTSLYLQNQSTIESLTEIYGNYYTYPNSAIVRTTFDAKYFSKIPDRAFETNLLKIKIPGNYNPILRTYSTSGYATENSGWNGQFATGKQWSNNPAWCFYDLMTNKRYGLGKYINDTYVDKFTLYEIGKNCDTLVANGEGGLEPRFVCNLIINTREEAYKVMNDLASIFYGITYYSNGMIFTSQDSQKTPILEFNNANVENGDFNYSSIGRKNRYTVAIVRYNDPRDFYKPAIEYVEDLNGIRKYGIMETDISAFGCTSRGQAQRLGKWVLLTNNIETETVSFNAGMDGAYIRPGDVFKIFDSNRKSKRHGGRIDTIVDIDGTGTRVTLDGTVGLDSAVEYKLSVVTPGYNYDPTSVSGLNSNDYSSIRKNFIQNFTFSGFQTYDLNNKTIINLYSGFDMNNYYVSGNPVWLLELSDRYSDYSGIRYFTDKNYDYYRAINIKESDDNKYEVVGMQYYDGKYNQIESGLVFERYTAGLSKVPSTPKNLTLDLVYKDGVFDNKINFSFLQDDINNVNSYKIYMNVGPFDGAGVPPGSPNQTILNLDRTHGVLSLTETNVIIYVRVYASNDIDGILSAGYAESSIIDDDVKRIKNVIISSLSSSNINSASSNSSNRETTIIKGNDFDPTFTWQVGYREDSQIPDNIKYRITVRPVVDEFLNSRLPTETILYQETGIIPSGGSNQYQFTLDKNISIAGGPYRTYQMVVEAHDSDGYTSAGNQIGVTDNNWNTNPYGYDVLVMNNPRPEGIELSDNIPTQAFWGTGYYITTGNHKSVQYIGSKGDVVIKFTSGIFDDNIVGGYLYVSNEPFANSGFWVDNDYSQRIVSKTQFDFDPTNPTIYSPTAAFDFRGSTGYYVAISFYDKLDQALIDKGQTIYTDLYISDNAIVYNDPAVGSISIGAVGTIKAISTTGYPTLNSAYLSGLLNSGIEFARSSSSGVSNTIDNTTVIFYIDKPIMTGYLEGGGGIGGRSVVQKRVIRPYGFSDNSYVLGYTGAKVLTWLSISGLYNNSRSGIIFGSELMGFASGKGLGPYDQVTDKWNEFSGAYLGMAGQSTIKRMYKQSLSTGFQIFYRYSFAPFESGVIIVSPEQVLLTSGKMKMAKDATGIIWRVESSEDWTMKVSGVGGNFNFYSLEIEPHKMFIVTDKNGTTLNPPGDYVYNSVTFHNSIYNY